MLMTNQPSLRLPKLYLEREGAFAVDTLTSANEALIHLKTERYDAIISDYQMPEMDGITFLRQLKASGNTTPFIIFTGRGREEVVIEALNNGADFYIQKGGEPKSQFAELSNKIQKAVDHRRADMQVDILNRLYSVLSATNKAIVRIHNKKELLNEICRIVIDTGGFTMAWAGRVNPKTHIIEPIASYGHIDEGLDTVAISTYDIPHGQGPTGTAFRERTFNVCNDIASDPKTAPWREWGLKLGYRSFAAFPFALDTRNAGVITYYASESGFFTDPIIRLLDEQTSDISFAFVTLDHEEERIAAEQDLKKSELQYRRLFETAQDAILILDGDTGEIIDANTFILDMLGYPLEYFINKHLWELGFIRDKSIAQQAFTDLKKNGYIHYEDIPLETKDGRSITVDFISNAYLAGDKKIFQCNIRDITNRKRNEDALAESEEFLNKIINSISDPIYVKDRQHRVILVNDAACRLFNLSREEIKGKTAYELFPGKEMADISMQKDEEVFRTGEESVNEEINTYAPGKPVTVFVKKTLYTDTVGNQFLVGITTDITVRKRAEEALRRNEEKFHNVFDWANDAILLHTLTSEGVTGRFIEANLVACRMLGYGREELLTMGPSDIVPPGLVPQLDDIIRQAQTKDTFLFEILLRRKDGTTFPVESSGHLVNYDGRGIWISHIRDITERKQAEKALRESGLRNGGSVRTTGLD